MVNLDSRCALGLVGMRTRPLRRLRPLVLIDFFLGHSSAAIAWVSLGLGRVRIVILLDSRIVDNQVLLALFQLVLAERRGHRDGILGTATCASVVGVVL
jgi:hypothetical protein